MAKRKKNRRIKKTKYLSLLSLQFPGEKPLFKDHIPNNIIPIPTTTTTDHHHQLDLLLEKDGDDNMEYLLSASVDDDGGATTLTGLLLDSSSAADHVPVVVSSSDGADDELSPSAASVSYVSEAMNLVRTALRSRERDSSTHEERYVRYSEVVDDQRRRDHDEVSSRIAGVGGGGGDDCNSSKKNEYHYQDPTSSMLMRRQRLSLKLDYQEIMNAWSDKGGLYVHSDFPQTVPDIIDDFFCHPPIPNGGGLWSVPEGTGGAMSMLKMEEEEEEEEEVVVPQDEDRPHREEEEWEWKWKAAAGQREASVLRYKEKRRNRLFSKTIRYQVRKENAQKRPRVKGRFVKRN